MTLVRHILLLVLFQIYCINTYINGEIASKPVRLQQLKSNAAYYMQPLVNNLVEKIEKVNLQLFYECFCGDCRDFDTTKFKQVILRLNKYLNIRTYPYGNAETIEHDGKYTFKCQHGPGECYGNKLHACALNIIRNNTEALLYNTCMMDFSQENQGSDDSAAQRCGTSMEIDFEPIKACAKSEKGIELLKYYGDESKKANFGYVPYILVNGKESDGSNFMRDVCAAYTNPPPPCTSIV